MFVFAMEDGAFKGGLKLSDRGLRDVIGDLLGMFGPEMVAKVRDAGRWHGR
jgi:hypothetical protein